MHERDEFEFLRKSSLKTMDDCEGFRLRTVKLRGQISQGLLIDPSILQRPFAVGEDVTEELGIVKYEAPIPACLGGDVVGGFPAYVEKSEMEAICGQLGLPIVPPLGEMTIPESLDAMLDWAEGKSVLNPKTQREGLVWVHGSGDDRVSFKTISNKFLAKSGE